jgi:uncharacterized membrane protein
MEINIIMLSILWIIGWIFTLQKMYNKNITSKEIWEYPIYNILMIFVWVFPFVAQILKSIVKSIFIDKWE